MGYQGVEACRTQMHAPKGEDMCVLYEQTNEHTYERPNEQTNEPTTG